MTLFLLLLFHPGQDAETRQQNTLQSVYNLQQLLPLQVFIVHSCFLNHAIVMIKKVHLHCYFSWNVKFLAVFMRDQLLMLLKQYLLSPVITVVTARHTDPSYEPFKVKLGGLSPLATRQGHGCRRQLLVASGFATWPYRGELLVLIQDTCDANAKWRWMHRVTPSN